MTCAEDGVLAVELGRRAQRDVELAVGVLGRYRVCAMPRRRGVPPLLRDLRDADRLAAVAACPTSPAASCRATADRRSARRSPAPRDGTAGRCRTRASRAPGRARRSSALPLDRSRTRSTPLAVSSTMTARRPETTAARTHGHGNQRTEQRNTHNSRFIGPRTDSSGSTSSQRRALVPPSSRRFSDRDRQSRNSRTADTPAGRRSGPRSPDTD